MTSPLKARKPTLKRRPPTFSAPAPTFWPSGVLLDLMRLPEGADELAFPRWTLFKICRSYRKDERHFLVCSLQYFALIGRWSGGCKNKNISKMSLLPQWSVGHLHNHWPPPGVSGPTVAKCGDTISANKKTQKAFSQLYTVSQPLRAKRGQKLLDSKSEASTTDHHVRSPDHAGFLNVSSFIRLSF